MQAHNNKLWTTFLRVDGQMRERMSEREESHSFYQSFIHTFLKPPPTHQSSRADCVQAIQCTALTNCEDQLKVSYD